MGREPGAAAVLQRGSHPAREDRVRDLEEGDLGGESPGAHARQCLRQVIPRSTITMPWAWWILDRSTNEARRPESSSPVAVSVPPSRKTSVAVARMPRPAPGGRRREGADTPAYSSRTPKETAPSLEREGESPRRPVGSHRGEAGPASRRASRAGGSIGRLVGKATMAGPSLAVNCISATARDSASEGATRHPGGLSHHVHDRTHECERVSRRTADPLEIGCQPVEASIRPGVSR